MSSRKRNIITGAVVLFALGALAWMTMQFTGRAMAIFKPRGMPIVFSSNRGDGLSDGSPVLYRGVQVGKVTAVRRMPDNEHVRVDAEVNDDPPLPRNISGEIRTQSQLSSSSQINLEVVGQPQGRLEPYEEVPVRYVGNSIFPPELSDLLGNVRRQQLVEHVDQAIVSLRIQIEKAGKVMDDVQQLTGDGKLQNDLRAAVANVRSATERADKISANLETLTNNANATVGDVRTVVAKTGDNVDHLTRQVSDSVDKLGKVLNQFEQASAKLNSNKGTAGALLNDPKLYDELTDTAHELNVVATSLQRLIDQWEHEGVSLKLK
ncbi:MAG: Mammalian cell entry related domain protein [Phycisphaerales bacterium]|nr:Mammalian cell entry related domain protein [Phycisphaerales bacterium]